MVAINHGPTRENGWHYVGICRACWAMGVGPTSNQRLAIKLARWAKWHRANVICRRRANKTADKMPALAQQMIAVWGVSDTQVAVSIIMRYRKSVMLHPCFIQVWFWTSQNFPLMPSNGHCLYTCILLGSSAFLVYSIVFN